MCLSTGARYFIDSLSSSGSSFTQSIPLLSTHWAPPAVLSRSEFLCYRLTEFYRQFFSRSEFLYMPSVDFTSTLFLSFQAVGYGFVLRGASPCYIQTVDPDGPARKAGVKVSAFLVPNLFWRGFECLHQMLFYKAKIGDFFRCTIGVGLLHIAHCYPFTIQFRA